MGLTDKEIGFHCRQKSPEAVKTARAPPLSKPARADPSPPPPPPPLPPPPLSSTGEAAYRCGNSEGGGAEPSATRDTAAAAVDSVEEDDECSVYFRSDSTGGDLARRCSRSASISSGANGRGKRTVYLGRSQKFTLRRVESRLAVGDRGFGLSGAPVADVGGEGLPTTGCSHCVVFLSSGQECDAATKNYACTLTAVPYHAPKITRKTFQDRSVAVYIPFPEAAVGMTQWVVSDMFAASYFLLATSTRETRQMWFASLVSVG